MDFTTKKSGMESEANVTFTQGGRLRAIELAMAHLRGFTGPSVVEVPPGSGDDLPALAAQLAENADLAARVRSVDARQLRDLTRGGATVIAPVRGAWLVADARGGTVVSDHRETRKRLTSRTLRKLSGDDRIEAIVFEPRLSLGSLSYAHTGSSSPWTRLRKLITLEGPEMAAILVFAIALGGLSLAVPVAVQVLVNTIAFGSLLQPLVTLAILLFGVLALSALIQVAEWYAMEVLMRRVFVRVAEDFSRRFAAAKVENADMRDGRELANRFFDAVSVQKTLSGLLLDGLGLALQTAVGLLLLAFYHPVLLAFDVALLFGLGLVLTLGYGAVPSSLAESQAKYRVAAWVQEIAGNFAIFKREDAAIVAAQKSDALTRAYLGQRRQHYRVVLRQLAGGLGLQVLAMVALLGLGGWLVMKGELTLGQLVAAELVVGTIGVGFAKVGKQLEKAYDLLASLDKIGMVLDMSIDPPAAGPQRAEGPLRVRLDGLRLARGTWRSGETVDLRVDEGARLHLAGPGGCGKSTLLETLAGLRSGVEGKLRLEGARMASGVEVELRKRAYLVRGNQLVEGTILENLRFGRFDASEDEAWAALETAGLTQVVRALDDGLETKIGREHGPLSTSQRARLCLARALLCRPELMLIDGALDLAEVDTARDGSLLEAFLGEQAPWAAVVVTRDPNVRTYLKHRYDLVTGATGGTR